jgi:hypothetical protein
MPGVPCRNASDKDCRQSRPPLSAVQFDYRGQVAAKGRYINMPTETAVVIAAIILVFAVFVVALAWASYYTRNVRVSGAVYFHKPK